MMTPAFSIRFAGDLPVWMVLVAAVVAVTAVILLYQRESKTLASPYNVLLPALRATAVAMVVLILAGPVWHRRQVVGTLGRVVFAVDTSQSMSLTDSQSSDGNPNRLRRASDWLLGDDTRAGWIEQIRKTHAVDVIAFHKDQPVHVWSSDGGEAFPDAFDWSADGAATNLSQPLSSILSTMNLSSGDAANDTDAANDSMRRSAVVMMSDGRDTDSAKRLDRAATTLAKQLNAGGTTVNTLGFGSVDDPPDLSIADVVHPETVAVEGKLAGQIVVNRFAGGGEPVLVRIEADGEQVWQKSLTMPASGQQVVPFEIDVEPLVQAIREKSPRGIERNNEVLRLVAKVESSGPDFSTQNNTAPFRVAASSRSRRLLIVDSSSRWETRYLKNLFVRDPSWQADVVLFGPSTAHPQLPRGNAAGQFPDTDQAISQYDAILLGEVDSSQFTIDDRGRISQFVADGGGLIIIDGRFGRLRTLSRTEFGELLPVRYSEQAPSVVPQRLEATASGLEQPVLGLIDQSDRLSEFWKKLPAPKWNANVEATEGAEVWAETVTEDGRRFPWLATRMYGAGRVFYLSSDQTWRWRYKVADLFHSRFWNQLVIAAMEPPYSASDQFVAIGTDQVEYLPGQPVSVRARLRDVRGNPVADSTVDAVVMHRGSAVATVPMRLESADRGTYEGLVPPLPPGEYAIRIRASGFDESALLASTPIWITAADHAEMQRMSLDEDTLRQIASAGGGQYIHESDAGAMLELLKPLSSGTVVESDTVMWETYYWFWTIVALLTAEWWLRKRAGLV